MTTSERYYVRAVRSAAISAMAASTGTAVSAAHRVSDRGISRVYDLEVLFTIGHSNRSLDELVAMLRGQKVRCLVDIRRFPRSRTNPQFNADALTESLPEDVRYTYIPALGGRRGRSDLDPARNAAWQVKAFHQYADYALTAPFGVALTELLDLAARERCAIMCAEAVWWRCHRRIVTDHVLAHGVPVTHLLAIHKGEPAKLTPFARVEGTTVTYPAEPTG